LIASVKGKEIDMKQESFSKLTNLKGIVEKMSLSDKIAFVSAVSSHLTPERLKTSDGQHAYSEKNILSVALGAMHADSRDEFEHITGFYSGGYKSELRSGLYHGQGDIPSKDWRREIRRLYHIIKGIDLSFQPVE
jgi:hypothetical protein